jgi:hypothetical protein
MRNNSGIVGPRVDSVNSTFSGMWKINEQSNYKKNDLWNISKIVRGNLLLNLDATNLSSYSGSGTTWNDISGHQLNASGASAITGQALQANQPYTTATTGILNTDSHSIFFSIQINNSSGTWDKIFGYTPTTPVSTDRSPGIWRWPSNRRIHWRYDPGNTSADFSADAGGDNLGTEFTPNIWYYVGVTKNGSASRSYVNGQLVGTSTVASIKTAGTSTIQLYPGYTQNSSIMRHVHIYNRVLTDQEILVNYNAIKSTLV